ncbi:hypothetical protein KTD26_34005 [Burkholderia multivorans]|nr:hypothetical protein [Burkholderia multivorans]MBU9147479.1 hypothetical protein [Burkholderia multivorans]
MNKSTKSQFGGALQAALDAVIEKGASVISVAEAGSKEAFLDGWTRTLIAHARHLRASKQELHGPIVMVHIHDSGPFATSMGWKRNPMLGSSPTDKLAGILAAGTGDIGGCVHPKRFTGTTEVVEEIQNAGLGSALTVGPVRFLVCRGHETITEITSYDRCNRDQEEQEPEGAEAVPR